MIKKIMKFKMTWILLSIHALNSAINDAQVFPQHLTLILVCLGCAMFICGMISADHPSL